jgi:sugar phosphate isomerase/epimerase
MILSADPPPHVAFSTLAFPDATLARAVSLGRRWGYAGVELRLIDGELIDPSMPAAERARVKRALAGLPVVAVDSSIRLTDLLRPHLVYLQVKDALAATGEVVPAGQGDGELRETLAALRDSGFAGFMSLEPHLAQAGRFGGFSGPEGFHRAAEALKFLLNEASIPWR